MSQGRCSGCGETGPHRAIQAHTVACPDFAVLFHQDPDRALSPSAEYERWAAEDRPAEKAAARVTQIATTNAARTAQADRFRTVDILGD